MSKKELKKLKKMKEQWKQKLNSELKKKDGGEE